MNIFIYSSSTKSVVSRPDTTIARNIPVYYIPDYLESVEVKAAIGIKAFRAGKSIKELFAHRYFDKYFPALILSGKLKENGEISVSKDIFDKTTLVPIDLIPLPVSSDNFSEINFLLNNTPLQLNCNELGLDYFSKIVEQITQFSSIKKGDMIIVEIGDSLGLSQGDIISASLGKQLLIETEIR